MADIQHIFNMAMLFAILAGGCITKDNKSDTLKERSRAEQVIKGSITWAMDKDRDMLYRAIAHDSSFFYFAPDNAGTISGFAAFEQLVDRVFMNPSFKAIGAEFRDLRIQISHSGDCAWWSCLLSDFNEWNGIPVNWENVRWTGVLEKRDGEWKIVQMHFSHAAEDFAEK